jgi:hypothetical protein
MPDIGMRQTAGADARAGQRPVSPAPSNAGRYASPRRSLATQHPVPNGMRVPRARMIFEKQWLHASLLALFNHLYTWVHCFSTELPNMKRMYRGIGG